MCIPQVQPTACDKVLVCHICQRRGCAAVQRVHSFGRRFGHPPHESVTVVPFHAVPTAWFAVIVHAPLHITCGWSARSVRRRL